MNALDDPGPAVERRPRIVVLDCDHRGEAIGAKECQTCGSRGRLETVYACALFGECTLGRWRHVAGDHVCSDCTARSGFCPPMLDRKRIERGLLDNAQRFNNSLIRYEGRLLMAYRLGIDKARIGLAELDEQFQPVANWLLPLQSGTYQEDPRLWIYRGELHASFSAVKYRNGIYTDIGYARLAKIGDEWTVAEEFQPDYPGRSASEKNWGFFEHEGDLLAVYSIDPHKVVRISGNQAELAHESPCDFGGKAGLLRGGAAPVLYRGEFYCFYHRVLVASPRTYTIDLYTFEAKPPFRPARHIPASLLTPHAGDRPKTGQVNCAFACGAYRDSRGSWVVSFGYQDHWSELAKWDGWHIEQALKPLPGGPFAGLATALPTDLSVWKQVAIGNEYRLPDDMSGQIVVDVGANIGSFSWACLQRGAAQVVACEPIAQYLDCARKNCRDDRAEFIHAYITGTAGERLQSLYDGPTTPEPGTRSLPLDAILETLPRVDVLKLDCEGPEHSIVANCDLTRVVRIVGECHKTQGQGIDSLTAGLRAKGFTVEWSRAGDGLWNFWAERTP